MRERQSMWITKYPDFVVLLLVMSVALTGCQVFRGTVSGSGTKPANPTSGHSNRDWLDAGWLATPGQQKDTLMVLKAHGSNLRPVGVLVNIDTGTTTQLQGVSPLDVHEVACDHVSGNAAISAEERIKPNALPTRGIWLCTPKTHKVRMAVSLGYDMPLGLIWSPSGSTLAAWLYLNSDIEKRTEWFIPPNSKKGPEPKAHPVPCLIDVKTGSVKRLNCTGYPSGWSADSKALYINTDNGTVRYNLVNNKIEKTPHRSLADRIYALPGSQRYLGLEEHKSDCRIDVVEMSSDMKTLRLSGSIKNPDDEPVLSPDKTHLAYRSGGHYYVFSVKEGRVQALGKVKGSMGPVWIDNQTLTVSNTSGVVSVLSIDGSVTKTYQIKDSSKLALP